MNKVYEDVHVDLPDSHKLGGDDGSWGDVGNFKTKEETVAWMEKLILSPLFSKMLLTSNKKLPS